MVLLLDRHARFGRGPSQVGRSTLGVFDILDRIPRKKLGGRRAADEIRG
ncbi:hypothetical protein PYK79_37545 [Streptomyces sp. ID05-04B]|nr:hypothetical protein [Streptomyces sp. ID05-04B]